MKAITIDPDYCAYIAEGTKTVECRTWKTNYRGELLICAGKRPMEGFISGYAYTTVELLDVVPFTEMHLEAAGMTEMPSEKCYAWILANPYPIYPIKVRGRLGLFDVDDSLIKYVDDDAPEDATDEELDQLANEYTLKYLIPITYLPAQQ